MNTTETGIKSYVENEIIIAEIELKADEGVSFIYQDTPFIFLRKGLTEKKRDLVKAYLTASVWLGFSGAWGNGFVPDRRDVSESDQHEQIGLYMDRLLGAQEG